MSDLISPEYVAARRALLDVLELLDEQRAGIVLVGAQAVYLRAPAKQAQLYTYTTDGDLALDPDLLAETPDAGQVLIDAGYELGPNPGTFFSPTGVEVDLMVPAGALRPSSRRTAVLPGQSPATARRTAGLELALLDASLMPIPALDPEDLRVVEQRVAGPAALTVAKLVKLDERLAGARRDRIISKDAGDLLRLFRYCDAGAIGSRLRELVRFDQARPVIYRAVDFLEADLGSGTSANRGPRSRRARGD